jgi:hypothetical protein
MESIKIDNDVFAHLQKHARPLIDTPNSTLRRLLSIDSATTVTTSKKTSPVVDAELEELPAAARSRSKAPKADLKILIGAALLRNGQKLHLVDYQGNKVQRFSPAVISSGDLVFNSQHYSMSGLAQELLAKVDFRSNSVRGPAHWVTDDNKTIKDLWQQYLDRNTKK